MRLASTLFKFALGLVVLYFIIDGLMPWGRHPDMSAATFSAGEGNFDAPLNTAITSLPQGWRDYEESSTYRHLDGGNYAFVDGHVKWLKAEEVTNESPKKADVYTFQIN